MAGLIEKRNGDRVVDRKKKIVVLYHGNCTDGFTGAWAAWKKFGNKAQYIGVKHSAPPPAGITDKDAVYMIDYTYPWKYLSKIIKDNKRVTSVDHHISAKENTEKTFQYSYALNNSGAVLAWKYFHPEKKVPVISRHVEDIDIWKFKLPRTREIFAYMDLFDYDFKTWDKLAKKLENPKTRKQVIKDGTIALLHEDRLVDRLVANNAELVKFEGIKAYAINSPNFPSQLGHRLVLKLPPIGIVWHEKADKINVSLRSDGNTDVAKLAGKYGGGGHKAASAFTVPKGSKLPWKALESRS